MKYLSILIIIALALANASGEPSDTNSLTEKVLEPNIADINVAVLTAQTSVNKNITYKLAQTVAAHYAKYRWEGARVGEGQLYVAPDGAPEVYYFVVFKKGASVKTQTELLNEVRELRSQRVKIEETLGNIPESTVKTERSIARSIWVQMSAADKYGTIVVGAHEGREPFVASYNGLPPHIFLKGDAIETRRNQIKGENPGEPKYLWLPPLYVVFEFPPTDKQEGNRFLEARGIELKEALLAHWERSVVPENVLRERKGKWQGLRRALNVK